MAPDERVRCLQSPTELHKDEIWISSAQELTKPGSRERVTYLELR